MPFGDQEALAFGAAADSKPPRKLRFPGAAPTPSVGTEIAEAEATAGPDAGIADDRPGRLSIADVDAMVPRAAPRRLSLADVEAMAGKAAEPKAAEPRFSNAGLENVPGLMEAEGFGDIVQPALRQPPPLQPTESRPSIAAQPKDAPGPIARGFVSGLLQQNPTLSAETLEGLAHLGPEAFRDTLLEASRSLRGLSGLTPEEYRTQAKRGIFDSESFGEAMTALGEQFGAGLASTVPPLITGAAGTVIGGRVGGRPGAVVGGLGGAALPSFAFNYGELYAALKEAGIEAPKAAEYALYGGIPMASLDVGALGPVLSRLGGATVRKEAVRSIARRIAEEAAKGAGREGITEAAQEAIKEATVSIAADKPFWTLETAKRIGEAGTVGALVGATYGGATGIVPDRPAPTGPAHRLSIADVEAMASQPQPVEPPADIPPGAVPSEPAIVRESDAVDLPQSPEPAATVQPEPTSALPQVDGIQAEPAPVETDREAPAPRISIEDVEAMAADVPETPAPAEPETRPAPPPEPAPPTRADLEALLADKRPLKEIAAEHEARVQAARAPVQGSAVPGVNFTGYVQAGVEGTARADPIRREAILSKLTRALGMPIYTGRMEQRRSLSGFFRKPIEEVRIKRPADIETAAHEIAHLIDFRIPEVRRQWHPATNANAAIRDELRNISYDRNKLYEGFAEFVRLWMTQPNQARAKAPIFHAWFEDFVGRSEYGPALREAQRDMVDWFEQDAVTRARSKIGVPPAINAFLDGLWSRLRQAISDDLHGVYRLERTMTGAVSPVGAYETARLVRGKMALTEGALLYGAPVVNPDGSHGFKGKGLQQILDPVADNLDDALFYFVGRSADELMQQGREHLFTEAEVRGMLALRTPERETAFREYQEWNKAILDFAEAKGIINPHVRAQWKRAQYLPFHRVGQGGPHQSVPGDWKGIKALTGGSENLRDILGNMIGNAAMLIDAALTNEARAAVADLAKRKGGALFMAEIPTEERHVKVHRLEVERAILEALGVAKRGQLPPDTQKVVDGIVQNLSPMVWLTLRGQAPHGPDVVAVLRRGRPQFFQVADPILYRALLSLNRPTRHWLIRLLSVPRRIGQASITLSIDFITANVARDTLMGFVMSRHGFKPFLDSARGLKSRITADQNYRDFVANGGGFSSYLVDENAFKVHLERFYGRRGIGLSTVLHTPAKLLLGLERIADAFEVATRLGEYRRAIERGAHPRHAAYSGREVSTDFGMRGDSATLGFLYDTVIFLKAAVNGLDRLYRGLAHDPDRVKIAAKAVAIAGASMALYALNAGNPLYDDLEDWDRDTHWHIFIPTEAYYAFVRDHRREPRTAEEAEKLFVHLRLPKIWETGALASIAERSLARLVEGAAKAGNLAAHIWRIVREVMGFEYIPQAFAPAVEVAMNRNRFLDRPIETQAEQEMQPWARSGPYSSRALRWYGENVARHFPKGTPEWIASPKQLEALLRGYLNTWALYGLTLADAAFFDDIPELRLDQYPGLRRFYQEAPARSTKAVTELYDAIEEATKARRTMRFMDRTWRKGLADELERTPENMAYRQLHRADVRMRALRKEMAGIMEAPTLEAVQRIALERALLPSRRDILERIRQDGAWEDVPKLKRWLMDDLTRERNQYAREVMADIRARLNAPANTAPGTPVAPAPAARPSP